MPRRLPYPVSPVSGWRICWQVWRQGPSYQPWTFCSESDYFRINHQIQSTKYKFIAEKICTVIGSRVWKSKTTVEWALGDLAQLCVAILLLGLQHLLVTVENLGRGRWRNRLISQWTSVQRMYQLSAPNVSSSHFYPHLKVQYSTIQPRKVNTAQQCRVQYNKVKYSTVD